MRRAMGADSLLVFKIRSLDGESMSENNWGDKIVFQNIVQKEFNAFSRRRFWRFELVCFSSNSFSMTSCLLRTEASLRFPATTLLVKIGGSAWLTKLALATGLKSSSALCFRAFACCKASPEFSSNPLKAILSYQINRLPIWTILAANSLFATCV